MKRIALTLVIALALIMPAKAQEKEDKIKSLERLEQKAGNITSRDTLIFEQDTLVADEEDIIVQKDEEPAVDAARVNIGDLITVEDTDNETVIRIGHKGLRISEDGDNTDVKFENYPEYIDTEHPGRRFRGHLGGIEFGFNNYSTGTWGSSPAPVDSYFDLNTSKSTCFNLMMPGVNLGITKHLGFVSALGLNFSNYRFDGNNSIDVDEDGIVVPLYAPSGVTYKKSKLSTAYVVLPVLLEAQIPVSSHSTINLGAGVIGAVKLGSYTKVVYYDDGKQKEKNRDDFSLNLLRYGVTARLGYEMVQIYGTCYLSPMFEKGKGPELYPFEIGLALTLND
jgi:hypothetical protein